MKKITIIICLLLSIFTNAQESNLSLWNKANDFYESESYEEAINYYQQIVATDEVSADLYYNLGNAYYKSGDINNAILNYERALKLNPKNEDIQFNLGMANQQVVTKVDEVRAPFFTRMGNNIGNYFAIETWGIIAMVSFIFFLLLLTWYLITKRRTYKKISFFSGILMLLVTIVIYSFALKEKNQLTSHQEAIIFCPRVSIKSSPNKSGKDLFLIYEGVKVQILKSENDWSEIVLKDKSQGWMPDSCMVKI